MSEDTSTWSKSLQSHGPGSNLLEHLEEVISVAENLEERIILVCHDIGKTTEHWQHYSNSGFSGHSPHRHAGSGALLATAIILLREGTDKRYWATVSLHTTAAHHSYLAPLKIANVWDEIEAEFDSELSLNFLLNQQTGIASLLPEVEPSILRAAWDKVYGALSASREQFWDDFLRDIASMNADERLRCFLSSRDLLSRLCFADHQSARKQSGKTDTIQKVEDVYPRERAFTQRPQVRYRNDGHHINQLRARLNSEFLNLVKDNEGSFYFIDAPTGMGKTETMLSAAESLVENDTSLKRVVFAVPQVSIADQLAEDYLSGCDAQIWNYIRKEALDREDSSEEANDSVEATVEVYQQPFARSYNITTFNQVLLAMAHPLRHWAVRSLGLRDAVLIFDEFHKLPLTVLPFFFEIAQRYVEKTNCRIILGSATPLADVEGLRPPHLEKISDDVTGGIYADPVLNGRRVYNTVGELTVDDVGDRVAEHLETGEDSLLVVLNLVQQGTFQLRKRFTESFDPWAEIENLYANEHPLVFLDGLTPPILRREIVLRCKEIMKLRPVTLVTTQMVEVGVDLDFDRGLIDFQGWAQTIQRGGRVGREGRANPSTVDVFSLSTSNGDSSYERLIDVQLKHDVRFRLNAFERLAKMEESFHRRQIRGFRNWNADNTYTDEELKDLLVADQEKAFTGLKNVDVISTLFDDSAGLTDEWGLTFENAQFVADLYGSTAGGKEIVLLESQEIWQQLQDYVREIQQGDREHIQDLTKLLANNTVRVFDDSFLNGAPFSYVGELAELGGQKVYVRSGVVNVL